MWLLQKESIADLACEPFTEARYAELFRLLEEVSHEYEAMTAALVERLSQYDLPNCSLLDIGSGEGRFIREVLAGCRSCLDYYRAYEPNSRHYQSLVVYADECVSCRRELVREPFTPDTAVEPVFDLVLMSHSLYWMQSVEPYIGRAMSALKSGGKLLIFIQSPVGIYSIQQPFLAVMRQDKNGLNQHYSAAELMTSLAGMGLKARETVLPGYFDLTSLWDDEARLLEFFSFFVGGNICHWSQPVKQMALYYLRANTYVLGKEKRINQSTSLVEVIKD